MGDLSKGGAVVGSPRRGQSFLRALWVISSWVGGEHSHNLIELGLGQPELQRSLQFLHLRLFQSGYRFGIPGRIQRSRPESFFVQHRILLAQGQGLAGNIKVAWLPKF